MKAEVWAHHSHAIVSLLDNASPEQLTEMIADIDDLYTATVESELCIICGGPLHPNPAKREADEAEGRHEECS